MRVALIHSSSNNRRKEARMIDRSRQLIAMTTLASVAGLAALALTHTAAAQAPRPQLNATAQPMPNEPQFRDPKTGQIWTPANVGEGGARGGEPVSPSDRAFNPRQQTTTAQGVIDQDVGMQQVGTLPITAGPTVPLVEIDNITLSIAPSRRWRTVLYLNNNSASTFSPIVGCVFNNGGRPVERTRGLLPPVTGGERVGLAIYGPPAETFVDSVQCHVDSP